jgi:glycosyltransferase involved in cell wall biosynthesis
MAEQNYLSAADLVVQVCNCWVGSEAAAVTTSLHCGLRVIVLEDGCSPEEESSAVVRLPSNASVGELASMMEQARADSARLNVARTEPAGLDPARDGKAWRDAIERFVTSPDRTRRRRFVSDITNITPGCVPGTDDLSATAQAAAQNEPLLRRKQMLIDVTIMCVADVGTGIQRVTGNIVNGLIAAPPDGYRIELIRQVESGFVYARDYATQFLGAAHRLPPDECVELSGGDIFVGLDLNMNTPGARSWLESARHNGTEVYFVVYDLLPATMPTMFGPEVEPMYKSWLAMIIEVADGLLCISRSVADELRAWIDEASVIRIEPLRIGWFHLGTGLIADTSSTKPSAQDERTLAAMSANPAVLMVGTIEPRKGYRQILDAFDLLWARAIDVVLVIVGRRGWLSDDVVEQILSHPENGNRLFWLTGISDGILSRLYSAATVLLAASEGEGFGLPLVEAAQHSLPVIARDIPVFREVAGDHATYFKTHDPGELAETIISGIATGRDAVRPAATRRWQGWRESAAQLLSNIAKGDWYLTGRLSRAGASEWEWTTGVSEPLDRSVNFHIESG